jgi:general secretion pathway protein G
MRFEAKIIRVMDMRREAIHNPESKIQHRSRGFTLLEIIIVVAILSILTAAAVPMVRNTVRREREADLRYALRQIRQAVDRYKEYSERFPNAIPIELKTQSGYPKELEILEKGFTPANTVGTSGNVVRFLRKIPVDPMTDNDGSGLNDWGIRSSKDRPDSTSWGGEDVFDVYSKSNGTAMNGTRYKDW